MKILALLRHAKSTWDDPVARDFDRPLNKRGQKAARTVGGEMRSLGLGFDRVIASPALRVIETLADIEQSYGKNLGQVYDQRLYLASPATLIDLIHETGDETQSLLVVGHNPGLERLAIMLTQGSDGPLRSELECKYPTATLAEIALKVESWGEVAEGTGTLTRFVRPRDLDPELGPDEDSY
ncbi:MAG: histidine phosphatase family protein [Sphingosinicella sp.]|nr:histidine phosphatase family protein [Sphingosinicella sp.]